MADYSNFTDIEIKYSSEFKELYYLALFCLQYNEAYISDRPIDHTVLRHLRDRFMEFVVFPMLQHIPHPMAEKYNDHEVEIKPDFTTAFEAFKADLATGSSYTVDSSKATTS